MGRSHKLFYLPANKIYFMVSDGLLLFMLKIESTTRGTNSMPFLIFRGDHLRSTSGIICGSGSFAVQFGDHFRSGDHLRRCADRCAPQMINTRSYSPTYDLRSFCFNFICSMWINMIILDTVFVFFTCNYGNNTHITGIDISP